MKETKGLVVINKNDLSQTRDAHELAEQAPGLAVFSVSAKNGAGLEELKQALRKLLLGAYSEMPVVINNLRHKAALERTQENLAAAVEALHNGLRPEIVAVDLQGAKNGLEDVVRSLTSDDILERIFANFCIGK